MKAVICAISVLTLLWICGTASATDTVGNDEVDGLEVRIHEVTAACQSADELPLGELEEMIALCDSLTARVKEGAHPKKRLFLFRLKQCRSYFMYLLSVSE